MDYLHANPVKHGLVGVPVDWQWSSFHRWVRHGVYPADWLGNGVVASLDDVE
jgi:putative transposase